MAFSEILNYILGGGLLAAIVGIATLKAQILKARAEAEKALAEAEKVRIDNAEHATRILIENIVEPLKKELNETREELRETKKELGSTKREMARFRKAIGVANNCKYTDDCPVLFKLRDISKGDSSNNADRCVDDERQRERASVLTGNNNSTTISSDAGDTDRQLAETSKEC